MKEYSKIKTDDFYCIAAVLETILIRHNYTNYSQYDINNEFGLTILKTAKKKIEIFGPFLEDECLKIKGYAKKD